MDVVRVFVLIVDAVVQVSYISHINSKHGMNLKEYREHYGAQEEIKQYICR